MAMLKIKAFKLGTIQDCMHILTEFENEGITDSRFVRKILADHVHDSALESNISIRKHRTRTRIKTNPCPECGGPLFQAVDDNGELVLVDGIPILACKKCRWSAVANTVGEI